MEIHLIIIGLFFIPLGLVHIVFPKQFNWKQELKSLSVINKDMMYVHTFFIAITIFLVGILCLTSATDLINTTFGKRISLGLGIFFSLRLLAQFFGYSSITWKGKTQETVIHVIFSLFWAYVALIFILIFTC